MESEKASKTYVLPSNIVDAFIIGLQQYHLQEKDIKHVQVYLSLIIARKEKLNYTWYWCTWEEFKNNYVYPTEKDYEELALGYHRELSNNVFLVADGSFLWLEPTRVNRSPLLPAPMNLDSSNHKTLLPPHSYIDPMNGGIDNLSEEKKKQLFEFAKRFNICV